MQILHGVAGEQSTAFSFQITTVRYFPEEIMYVYVHCDVVLCSIRGGRRSEGYIKVISFYCRPDGAPRPTLGVYLITDAQAPTELVAVSQSHVLYRRRRRAQ